MLNLVDHTANRGCILKLTRATDFVQTKSNQRLALIGHPANGAFRLGYEYRLFGSHLKLSL